MTNHNFTQKDFREAKKIGEIKAKLEHIDNDYILSLTDEMFKYQPLYLSVLLGYHKDVSLEAYEEIIQLHILVWEYFRSKSGIRSKKVTESDYEKVLDRNIRMLKYSEGEPSQADQKKIFDLDLDKIKSKALMSAIFMRFELQPVLRKMNIQDRGAVLLELKSFVEIFERR